MLVEQRPSHVAVAAVIVPGILLRPATSSNQQILESGGRREDTLTTFRMDIHVERHF